MRFLYVDSIQQDETTVVLTIVGVMNVDAKNAS